MEEILALPKRPRASVTQSQLKTNLITNHFKVDFDQISTIYAFSIKFSPPIDSQDRDLAK
jgi:hypothetical protein